SLLNYIENGDIVLQGNIYVSDINPYLIALFNNIKYKPKLFSKRLNIIISEFKECSVDGEVNRCAENILEAKTSRESYYFWLRKTFNEMSQRKKISTEGSAIFLVLNKTCFRGLYREGPNGF